MENNIELDLASNEECEERRRKLIDAGIIVPGEFKSNRERMIDADIINCDLYELKSEANYPKCIKEESEYISRPIKTNEEYERRKSAYFRMIQEVLFSRIDLNLNLAKKEDNDPSWYF